MPKTHNHNWTDEERDRIVTVFEWLLKEDRKQSPENYQKSGSLPTDVKAVE